MKTNLLLKKALLFTLFFIGVLILTQGQNVAITDDDTYSANSSAMLDVKSTNKGLLIPRVALISAHVPISDVNKPAGLLIWNSSPNSYAIGYYYWDGSDWSPVGAAVGNGLMLTGSKIELGGVLDKATTIQTGENLLEFDVNGANKLQINLTSTGDFEVQDDDASAFFVGDNGKVGIGLASPLHGLHLYNRTTNTVGTDGTYIDVQNSYNSKYVQSGIRFATYPTISSTYFRAGIFFRRTNTAINANGDLYLANNSGGAVDYTDAALIVKHDRKIGIGTSTPGALLQVKGDFILNSGAAVNEFSIDGAFKGNSDLAVPTEKAIKTYVDNNSGDGHTGGGTLNWIPRWTSSTGLGNSILYQNVNKIGIGTQTPSSKFVVKGNNGGNDTIPIFEVKNDAGQTVFAVFPKGVRVNVENSAIEGKSAGNRGGFAVGNLSTGKAYEGEEEFFTVARDSVRVYVSETVASKGNRGGFAVGNLSTGKGTSSLMQIEKDNYFIGHQSGIANTSGLYNTFFGYQAGISNTAGTNNVFIGYLSGFSNIDAQNNVFIGIKAGYNNLGGTSWNGDDNVFIGNNAGYWNTIGHDNVYLGNNAGKTNTQFYNVAIGSDAGSSSTSAFNTFVGNSAGQKATGAGNTYLGMAAARYNVTGSSNVYVGSRAGFWNTSGNNNVLIGYGAGELASGEALGSNNIFIGYDAGDDQVDASNKLIIESSNSSSPLIYGDFDSDLLQFNGNVGVKTAANSSYGIYVDHDDTPGSNYGVYGKGGYMGVRGAATVSGTGTRYGLYGLGWFGTSTNYGVYGYGYGGTTSYGVYGKAGGATTNWAGYFAGDIYTTKGYFTSSDGRMKKNISSISGALGKLNKIRGVYYEWDNEAIENLRKSSNENQEEMIENTGNPKGSSPYLYPEGQQVGVIAQEVELILPEAVKTDGQGSKSVDYTKLVPLLIQAINEQQQQIENQNKEIEKLKSTMLKSSISE